MNPPSFDTDYLRRLTSGDPSTELHFSEYFGTLLRIKLRSRLRSRQQVDDLQQETLLRVFKNLRSPSGGIDHPERLGAYVNSVCNHVLFEFYRSEARHPQLDENAPDPPDDRVDLDRELVSRERKQKVRDVLDDMPPKDRDILKMLFLDERDKDEICDHFRVDRDYLRVLVHRAKAKFRTSMAQSMSA